MMTLSDLIVVLVRIRAAYGDGPVVILDTDTAWEMPINAVRKTADGHYLLDGVGYTDDAAVRRSILPVVDVWRAGDGLAAAGRTKQKP